MEQGRFVERAEAPTRHELVTELSGLGPRAIGEPRGAGGAKESRSRFTTQALSSLNCFTGELSKFKPGSC